MCRDAKSLALSWKERRCSEKGVQSPRMAISEISKEMAILLLRTQNGFSSPSFRATVLWAMHLFMLIILQPLLSPQRPSMSQFNSCILIPLNTHLYLSFHSLSVKLHFFEKKADAVLSKLIFQKYKLQSTEKEMHVFLLLSFKAAVRVRYRVLGVSSSFSKCEGGQRQGGEQFWAEPWLDSQVVVGVTGQRPLRGCWLHQGSSATTAGRGYHMRSKRKKRSNPQLWSQTVPQVLEG